MALHAHEFEGVDPLFVQFFDSSAMEDVLVFDIHVVCDLQKLLVGE